MVDLDTFNSVYKHATPVQQYLFASSYSGEKLAFLAKKYNLLGREKYSMFAITVGDIVFGFYKTEDTIPLLQQELEIDEVTATQLGGEVLEFLKPLSDPNWRPPATEEVVSDTLETSEIVLDVIATETNTPITSIIKETTVIPEIRTMAGDMAYERSPDRSTFNAAADFEEPAYVSTQPIIEKKVVDVPSYSSPQYQSPKPDAPATDSRWN